MKYTAKRLIKEFGILDYFRLVAAINRLWIFMRFMAGLSLDSRWNILSHLCFDESCKCLIAGNQRGDRLEFFCNFDIRKMTSGNENFRSAVC